MDDEIDDLVTTNVDAIRCTLSNGMGGTVSKWCLRDHARFCFRGLAQTLDRLPSDPPDPAGTFKALIAPTNAKKKKTKGKKKKR